ncbi:MAG: hypothetical protein IJC56_08800 [Clostridia bacterium]|nr:hypothetical protein [Clostridia bacterium]
MLRDFNRKLISVFFIITMFLSTCHAYAEEVVNTDGWYLSSDEMLEIKFVSLEEDNYPNYKLTLQYRLHGEQESALQTFNYDLTSTINQYISQNATNKNRKAKVTSDGVFTKFDYQVGTIYSVSLSIEIGGSLKLHLLSDVDLSVIFPDDFVNYDIINIVSCINAHRNALLNSSSFTIADTKVVTSKKYDNIVYYTYNLTAQNRMGGNSTNAMIAIFDTSTGKFSLFVFDLDNLLDPDTITYDVTTPGYWDALREYTSISHEAVSLSTKAVAQKLH